MQLESELRHKNVMMVTSNKLNREIRTRRMLFLLCAHPVSESPLEVRLRLPVVDHWYTERAISAKIAVSNLDTARANNFIVPALALRGRVQNSAAE